MDSNQNIVIHVFRRTPALLPDLRHICPWRQDRPGLRCISLAPVFIIVAYATLLVSRREVHMAYVLSGQLLNGVLNAFLKASIGQPRPPGADHDGPGMPSDHAQFMAFWACYGSLFLRRHVSRLGRAGWRPILALAMISLAAAVSYSRVYLGYHTLLRRSPRVFASAAQSRARGSSCTPCCYVRALAYG